MYLTHHQNVKLNFRSVLDQLDQHGSSRSSLKLHLEITIFFRHYAGGKHFGVTTMLTCQKFTVTALGVLATCSVSLVSQAAFAAEARLQMNLFCQEQNENGDDEIYVVVSSSDRQSFLAWQGDMADDKKSKRNTGAFDIGRYNLRPGQSVALVVNVFEKDGQDYRPGLRAGVQVAQALGSVALGVPIPTQIGGLDVNSIIGGIGINTDDWIGAFSVLVKADSNGNLITEFSPKARSRWMSNGTMRLDGDGGRYFPFIFINGERRL
ncbi:hypothetical protein ACKFKG_17255 [Phormidesmis sp. 146-35]